MQEFDDLVLVFHYPDRVEMILWDGISGLCQSGNVEGFKGSRIVVPADFDGVSFHIHKIPGEQFFLRYFIE